MSSDSKDYGRLLKRDFQQRETFRFGQFRAAKFRLKKLATAGLKSVADGLNPALYIHDPLERAAVLRV